MISPFSNLFDNERASSPMQLFDKTTFLLIIALNLSATGVNLIFSFTCPFGLPKWAASITFAELSTRYLIVGIAALIRVSSVIAPLSSNGTLKSTLTKTFFPSKTDLFRLERDNFAINTS